MDKRIPVTVLTGDFGVGKTTLRNRILSEDSGRRYALILNLDADAVTDADTAEPANPFIISTREELFDMNSGCICCTIRGDLIRALHALLAEHTGDFDAIIIETGGAADPGPIVQTFFIDHILEENTRIDSIVAITDANAIVQSLRDKRPAVQQIGFADQIILNKTEGLDDAGLTAIEAHLRRINPLAAMHRTRNVAIGMESLRERGAFDLARGAALPPDFAMPHDDGADSIGGAGGELSAILLQTDTPLEFERVDDWLAALVMGQGSDILRGKGILHVVDAGGEEARLAFQSVQMLHEGNFLRPWAAEEKRQSQVVFIGRNFDLKALQTGFTSCAAVGVEAF